ncbi:MFS transporter [Pseudomonas sp. MBLB4136]|uniref:MFS transporter n=1 Tax=Pseudomonas sp. MBLB4136 TaxID=3451558 RepID=UPI003F751F81
MNGSCKSLPVGLSIVSIVCFNFVSLISNGLPLAVLPGHVMNTLGFGSAMAGLVIGLQYLTTLVSRPLAGQLADRFGAKRTVMTGLATLTASGLVTALAILLPSTPWSGLVILLAGRILQGIAAALISTPSCTWAIGLHGPSRTAQIMSWNGIAAYGGTAIGAPLGVLIRDQLGLASIGIAIILLGFLSLLFAQSRRPAPLQPGVGLPFRSVFLAVLPNGLAVACSSAGFGSLTAFIALYFDSLGWANAAYCLSAFGGAFIFARLVSPNVVPRFGGFRVVTICMLVQTLGLLLVWLAPSPQVAFLGSALTGLGVSWVYPGLAVETLARTPEANRTAALSTLSLFFDLAVGLAGPVMGVIVSGLGLAQVFLCSALLSAIGCMLVLSLHRRQPAGRT